MGSTMTTTAEQSGSPFAGTAQLPINPKQPLETLPNQTSLRSLARAEEGDKRVRLRIRSGELMNVTRPVERTPNQVSTQQSDAKAIDWAQVEIIWRSYDRNGYPNEITPLHFRVESAIDSGFIFAIKQQAVSLCGNYPRIVITQLSLIQYDHRIRDCLYPLNLEASVAAY